MDITALKGIGEKTAGFFAKLDITSVQDLLHYYPRDYEQYKPYVSIDDAVAGEVVAIRGIVTGNMTVKHIRNLSIMNFTVQDAAGTIQMTYFNMPYLKNSLKKGSYYIFRGLLQQKGNKLIMEQAQIYKPEEYAKMTDCMLPKYVLTKGLSNNAITKAVRQAFVICPTREEFLPEELLCKYRFMARGEAMYQMHFPANKDKLIEARRRLVFDEFFLFILMLRRVKEENHLLPNAYRMMETGETVRLIEELPYRLTKAQEKVWDEIKRDLCSDAAMNRLIQGDVGSGKTILAFLALIMCAGNGYQGALMAPTEVLAKQHMKSIEELFQNYEIPIQCILLTGSMTAKEKKIAYEKIASGEAQLIIGTHAMIQEKVQYHKLGLVVTDEQHRFGVRQRELLTEKGFQPHVLVMSATPIPRTLAIIVYGELDISVVDELPANRLPIKNCVVDESYRATAYRFMEKEMAAGHQIYIICPMVEENESSSNLDLENVVDYTQRLQNILPKYKISYLHGKMKAKEKNEIMERFAAGDIQILVSTTVIEVGINVPNATVMMVENAERFGLAQLHQLRGRVGRGNSQSYCIFMSRKKNKETKERLEVLQHSNDGFHIASEDLKLRGPGDLFGVRQSGAFAFKMADIFQDAKILQDASEAVRDLLETDPLLEDDEHWFIKKQLEYYLYRNGEQMAL